MKAAQALIVFLLIFTGCKKDFQDASVNNIGSRTTSIQDAINPQKVDAVLFNSNHTMYAFQPATGQLLWSKSQSGIASISAINNNTVFYNGEGFVYALDAATGRQLWKSKFIGQSVTALCAYNNKIYMTVRNRIYCLNAADGIVIWTFTQPYNPTLPNIDPSAPTVVNGVLYIGGNDETTEYALDAETGTQKWKYYNPNHTGIYNSPCVYENKVINVDYYGNCFALDTASGSLIWSHQYLFGAASPTVSNNKLYLSNGEVFCVNPANGNMIWQFSDTSTEITRYTSAECFVDNDKVFVPMQDHYYSLQSSTGSINWYSLIERTDAGMTEVNGILYFQGYYSNYLFAVNAATGTILWTYLPDGNVPTTGIIVSVNGKVTYPVRSGMAQ